MFTSHKQISPPSLVLKLKISEVSQKWIPKAVELKRIPTHKKCKCKKFCSQTRLVGEIYSSDVIMHRGYYHYLSVALITNPEQLSLSGITQKHSLKTVLLMSQSLNWQEVTVIVAEGLNAVRPKCKSLKKIQKVIRSHGVQVQCAEHSLGNNWVTWFCAVLA